MREEEELRRCVEEEELRRCVDEVIAAVLCNSELVSTSPHLLISSKHCICSQSSHALCIVLVIGTKSKRVKGAVQDDSSNVIEIILNLF